MTKHKFFFYAGFSSALLTVNKIRAQVAEGGSGLDIIAEATSAAYEEFLAAIAAHPDVITNLVESDDPESPRL